MIRAEMSPDLLLLRQLTHQTADSKIENTQTKRAEDCETIDISSRRCCTVEDLSQRATQEVTVSDELLGKVYRGLSTTDVIDVVKNVVATQDDIGIQVTQRHVQDRRTGQTH